MYLNVSINEDGDEATIHLRDEDAPDDAQKVVIDNFTCQKIFG